MQGYAVQTLAAVEETLGRIELIQDPYDVFDRAITVLSEARQDGAWDEVAVYSPFGLWEESVSKDRWLHALGATLAEKEALVSGFCGVFVLPPTVEGFDRVAVPRLMNFDRCLRKRRCQIRYLPPEDLPNNHPLSAPGMGMIIFRRRTDHPPSDQYRVLFGFASGNAQVLVNGFVVKQPDVGEMIYQWLMNQVLDGRARQYTLMGTELDGSTVSLKERLEEVRKETYRVVTVQSSTRHRLP